MSFLIGPPNEAAHSLLLANGRGVPFRLLNQSLASIARPVHQYSALPWILVGARLGHVGDLRAGLLTVLARVGIGDNGRFLQIVLAQRQVGGAGVVQVQVRIHVVLAVHGEQVRGGGKTGGLEVAVAHAGVHVDAGSGLGNVGNVVTAVGLVGDQVLIEVGRQVGVVRLAPAEPPSDFHRLRVGAHRHLHVGDRCLADVDAGRGLRPC